MKNRIIAALLSAFSMLSAFGLAAYAAEPEHVPEDEYIIEYINDSDEAVLTEHPDIDAVEIKYTPYEEKPYVIELPPLPPGTGTVIDFNTDPIGRLFFTIMADDEHVFYLVVDTTSNVHNVYFLNAVTVADLLPLAQVPVPLPSDTAPPPTITDDTEQVVEVPITPPLPEEDPQQGGSNLGTIIIIIIVLIGGGAGWYFKVYRPKQQRAMDGNEYDPDIDDIESEYTDEDWSEEEQRHHEFEDDTPPWDDDEEK